MRSLITGGAGFIGSHLVEHLLDAGDDVVVLDDLSTGALSNLDDVSGHPRLELRVGSVLDGALIDRLVGSADRVFHLAAAVGARLIVEQPLQSMRTNLRGAEAMLDAAARHGAALLLASTSEVYGKNGADRLGEDADRVYGSPSLARWADAAAHGLNEAMALAQAQRSGLAVRIVRLFSAAGPRQRASGGAVLPTLVTQAMTGRPMTVFGDGTQTRSFAFVGDVVPALVRLAECAGAIGQPVNLGGRAEISINDLASRVRDVLGSSSPIEHIPYDQAYAPGYEDIRRCVPDNALAHRLVGYRPSAGIDDMIRAVAGSRARALATV